MKHRKHLQHRLLTLLCTLICMLCIGSLTGYAAALPKPKIKSVQSASYRSLQLITSRSDKYILEILRCKSKNGRYKVIDRIDPDGYWSTSSSGYEYRLGENERVAAYRVKKQYYLVDTKTNFNQKYYYRIRYVSDDGTAGKLSNKKSGRSKLDEVSINDIYARSSASIYVSWVTVEGASGYILSRREGSGDWQTVGTFSGSSNTTYTDTNVSSGRTYNYKVQAYRNSKGKKVKGPSGKSVVVSTGTPTVSGSYSTGSVYGPKLTSSELLDVRRVVQGFKDNFITDSMSDYEKCRRAFQYIRYRCTYAASWQYNRANTAWGSLVYGEAQCSGYARGMKALCDAIGVPCYYVHANNGSHQWNFVQIDGGWYILDAQGGMFLYGAKAYRSYGLSWNTADYPTISETAHPKGGFAGSII